MTRPEASPEPAGVPDALATLEEVATFLKIPSKTLYRWRYQGQGPPAFRVGRYLRFRWADVELWLATRATEDDRDIIGA